MWQNHEMLLVGERIRRGMNKYIVASVTAFVAPQPCSLQLVCAVNDRRGRFGKGAERFSADRALRKNQPSRQAKGQCSSLVTDLRALLNNRFEQQCFHIWPPHFPDIKIGKLSVILHIATECYISDAELVDGVMTEVALLDAGSIAECSNSGASLRAPLETKKHPLRASTG